MKFATMFCFFSSLILSAQTVTIQANPIPMKTFGKISGLSEREYGLWHVTAKNNSARSFVLGFVDIQQCFPSISFLTADESQIVLTRDQSNSPLAVGLEIGQDAQLAAAAFLSPYALTAYPVLKVLQSQIQKRVPNEAKLLGIIARSSVITMLPGSDAVATMLAGLTHKAVESTCTLRVETPAGTSEPPAFLRRESAWINRNDLLGISQ